MKLHGCTEQQETSRVELSPDEIVDSGIDPWRLDLFEPAPIKRWVDGVELRFRKLENFSFAYRLGPEYVVIGLHDGKHPICLVGKQVGKTSQHDTGITIEGYRLSDRPFHHHLLQYLHLIAEKPCPTTPAGMLLGGLAPGDDDGGRPTAFRPRPVNGVNMHGSMVVYGGFEAFKDAREFTATTYVGKMHEIVAVPGVMSEQIAWVFRHLQEFEPIVFGAAVRRATKGESADRVDVLLHGGEYGELKQACEPGFTLVGDSIAQLYYGCIHKLVLGGTKYYLYNRRLLAITDEPFGSCSLITSADSVFCRDGATFGGTRIACNDIPLFLSRSVANLRPALGSMRKPAESALEYYLQKRLRAEGFRLSDYPHIPDIWGKWETA